MLMEAIPVHDIGMSISVPFECAIGFHSRATPPDDLYDQLIAFTMYLAALTNKVGSRVVSVNDLQRRSYSLVSESASAEGGQSARVRFNRIAHPNAGTGSRI